MWEVPRHRIRAYVRSLRQSSSARLNQQRAAYHIKRTAAQLSLSRGFATPADIVQARVILNDLMPDGIYVFSSKPLPYGIQVGLTIQEPQRFYAIARVTACKTIESSAHIISEATYPYRLRLEFEFASDSEQKAVREYCRDLARNVLYGTS